MFCWQSKETATTGAYRSWPSNDSMSIKNLCSLLSLLPENVFKEQLVTRVFIGSLDEDLT